MKVKIVLFVIGVLVGAVIATGAFYIYTNTKSCDCGSNNTQMNGGQPPEMPNGQNSENGQPPAKPGENNTQSDSQNGNN